MSTRRLEESTMHDEQSTTKDQEATGDVVPGVNTGGNDGEVARRRSIQVGVEASQARAPSNTADEVVMATRGMEVYYGDFRAIDPMNIDFSARQITALIGPSGCGKSTALRSLNRMNDLIAGAKVTGSVTYHGENIYDGDIDPVEIRRRIGMVFQKPNPFPKSIYDNIAWGAKISGFKGEVGLERADRGSRCGRLHYG